MLPQSVFEHLLYSDCNPGAGCTIDGAKVDIDRRTNYRDGHWFMTFHAFVGNVYLHAFALADLVANLPALDYENAAWDEYVTGEC